MFNFNYGYRQQCGGLDESLKTKKYINKNYFAKLLPEYEYYGYDERCHQFLFILRDMDKKLSCFNSEKVHAYFQRVWLFIEVQE